MELIERKLYVVGREWYYGDFIDNTIPVDNLEDADIVVFTGGEDVLPSSYGRKNLASYGNERRDAFEIDAYNKMKPNQLMVGICRGAQLACVLNGGNLVQDCGNHALSRGHTMKSTIYPEVVLPITSLHHQMMYPYDMSTKDYTTLFISENNLSQYYLGDDIDEEKIKILGEPEVVVFHKTDNPICLAIQGHPEMLSPKSQTVKTFNRIIDQLLRYI